MRQNSDGRPSCAPGDANYFLSTQNRIAHVQENDFSFIDLSNLDHHGRSGTDNNNRVELQGIDLNETVFMHGLKSENKTLHDVHVTLMTTNSFLPEQRKV